LAVYVLAALSHLLFRSTTAVSTVIAGVASAALVVWAGLEIARGVNPFRRGLGSVVLMLVVVSALRHTG
jgi:multisubunit Na+/H+ antiporter MnhE subunit